MSASCNDDTNDNPDNIIFTIKNTKLYGPAVKLSVRDNQELSKLLSKGLKRSVYWNDYKTKNENKNTTNEFSYFLESNFFGVNRSFVLVYTNHGDNSKKFNARKYYLAKGIMKKT